MPFLISLLFSPVSLQSLSSISKVSSKGIATVSHFSRVFHSIIVGEILKYLIFGCPRIRKLSCIFFNYTSVISINSVIKEMLNINPCRDLEFFCFERCFMHEATFFYLMSKLPNIKYIGNMQEWFMDIGAISRITEFIRDNNINVDIDSHKQSPFSFRVGL